MNQQFLEDLRNILGDGRIKESEPMSRHTTFRVGGPADVFATPDERTLPDVIRLCRTYGLPCQVIGNGSNLLVGDKGIRGLVISMVSGMDLLRTEGDKVEAGAGTLLSKTALAAAAAGLTGMEFAAGIPGSIGGAVVMNAGAYGGEMKDIVESVSVLDAEGCAKTLGRGELRFGYRASSILENGYIVTKVVLRLTRGDKDAVFARMNELKEMRREKQPLEYPSAGSTFKRPEGYYAGKLIMDAGLRGYQVGGAQVSEKHCGFVINRDHATADDIRRLMRDVSDIVKKQSGVALEPEVKMIGEFE